MHILQLANFYGATSGGLRVALDQLANQYLASGAHVTTVVAGERNRRYVDAHGRTFLEIRAAQLPGRMGGYRMILNPGAVERMIDVVRPDVIELSDKTTLAAAATRTKLSTPVVLISHERLDEVVSQSFSKLSAVNWAVRTFNNRIGDRVDAVVCCSDFAAQEFRADGDTRRSPAFPSVSTLQTFTAGPDPPETPRPQIITVVRLTVDKDPELLVETCRTLDRARGGSRVDRLRRRADATPNSRRWRHGLPMTFMPASNPTETRCSRVASRRPMLACRRGRVRRSASRRSSSSPAVPRSSSRPKGALPELVPAAVGRACERTSTAFADGVQDTARRGSVGSAAAGRTSARRGVLVGRHRAPVSSGLYEELIAQPAHPSGLRPSPSRVTPGPT